MTKKKAAKRPVKKSAKVIPWDATLERFLKALTELYDDMSAPGLICAFVPDRGFYVSVARYDKPFGEGRRVMFSAYGETFAEALDAVLEKWRTGTVNARFMKAPKKATVDLSSIMDSQWEDQV